MLRHGFRQGTGSTSPVTAPHRNIPHLPGITTRGKSPGRSGSALKVSSKTTLLHEIFEWQADNNPTAVAVVDGINRTTYGDLEAYSNRISRYLRTWGVGSGSSVAILLPRSLDAYAAILGALKAGCAYIPIDPEYPPERISFILDDCDAEALITNAELEGLCNEFFGTVIRIDDDHKLIDAERSTRLIPDIVSVTPRDLAYVVYTSGTTGNPKGVQIEHRSITNLVFAEGQIYGVNARDRVYQGASLAFDLSIEEIWITFYAGATLITAPREYAKGGPDLAGWLRAQKMTVLSCVPTVLSMLTEDVPSLRLIILGGETCPAQLIERWARSGRRIINTYGPTETTVIATYAELNPGRPITIGKPVPGYRITILDENLLPVSPGETGEICIAGIGVARGYVGLAEETREHFVRDPFAHRRATDARMYRTGDRGRMNTDGEIEFLGRTDGMVKLRGFRVEMAEIESILMQEGTILAAACVPREDTPGIRQLVAYVVPRNGDGVCVEHLQSRLRMKLPSYMVPGIIETITHLPRLPSGKLDRESLPQPRARETTKHKDAGKIRTETQQHIATVWESLFQPQKVSDDDDFFLDLGGHSLLAARMVSELRKDSRYASVSMKDIYEHPTISSLATLLDDTKQRRQTPTRKVNDPDLSKRHFLTGLVQTGGLYFVYGFHGFEWVTPFLVFFLLMSKHTSLILSAAWAFGCALAIFPILLLVAIGMKWAILGRIHAGKFALWGNYYRRFWFVRNLLAALPLDRLCGTPLLPVVLRLLGAKIGRNVHLETDEFIAFDLISIGDGTSIGDTASVLGCTVEEGQLILGSIRIGENCFVGTRAVVRENTVIEDNGRLEDLSLLPSGVTIPEGETWAGSPATRSPLPALLDTAPPYESRHLFAVTAFYLISVLLLPLFPLFAFIPGVAILDRIDLYIHPILYVLSAPIIGGTFVIILTVSVVVLKWLLVGRVREGVYPLHGKVYLRLWVVDQLRAISLDVVGSLHATLYLTPWYRALGCRLGKFVELSTATSSTPDLLRIDDGGTVADEASLGAAHVEHGWMTLAPVSIGQRGFVGNGAVIPPGTSLGDRSLVGVLSISPSGLDGSTQSDASWFGSPPILLPRRQPSKQFPEKTTYLPTRSLRIQRGLFEILRVTLPPAGFILVVTTLATIALRMWNALGPLGSLLLLPVVYAGCCIAVALTVVLAKWIIMGRFQPFEHPQWSWYVWRLEFVNALYEFLVTPLTLDPLQGTPFLPWYFRMLGAHIGRRTYFHTTGLIEFDLVKVGDDTAVNEDSVLQAHLFEDRILKASHLCVGNQCGIGAGSVVLYDTRMEDSTQLDALSLLMKGETLPAGTSWCGIPARKSGD